jgi:uncharacterized protein YigA (DUF484 family)
MSSQYKSATAAPTDVVISENDVASYLKNHPEFFKRNAGLLGDISLPHVQGNAVSLVERQVAVLRERSMSTRRKLSELMEHAKDND